VFEAFTRDPSSCQRSVLSGIQYFWDCKMAAKEDIREAGKMNANKNIHYNEDIHDKDDEDDIMDLNYTEEGLHHLIAEQTSREEEWHGKMAVEIRKAAGVFKENDNSWPIMDETTVANVTGDNLERLLHWKKQMANEVLKQNMEFEGPMSDEYWDDCAGNVEWMDEEQHGDNARIENAGDNNTKSNENANIQMLVELNMEQRHALDIILWHLDQTLSGKNPPQLKKILYGEGGTGKSRVMQAVTDGFVERGVGHMLVKSVYMGVVASIIDRKTTHNIGHLSLNGRGSILAETKTKLQNFWKQKRCIIIDEYSMLSKTFLAKLSQNISIGMEGLSDRQSGSSFGGANVILCGDLHQFPPVAVSNSEALYWPINTQNDKMDTQIGRRIYEEFTTVVILREQKRVTDLVWHDFLQHLRRGCVQDRHITMLKKLVIGDEHSVPIDFREEPWCGASLVMPRHAVREKWNNTAIRGWCHKNQQQLFVCTAEDSINGHPMTICKRYAMASRSKMDARRKKKDLPKVIEIVKGMKVMVTNNIDMDLDVTNGARGEIIDIILHLDEPPIGENPVVHLK
jgi:PIF1-like helicase